MGFRSERLAPTATAAAVLAMCAVTAVVTVAGSDAEYAWLDACVRALTVGIPIAVGLYARLRPASRRFGDLLVIAGVGWFLASLSSSHDPVLYSSGRVFGWLVEVALVYLVLAFPSGSLGRVDRALVGAAALLVALLYLPTTVLVEQYPSPAPWTSCTDDCPGNAFMLLDAEPAFVEEVIQPVREALSVLIFAAATARVAWRMQHASHVLRRSLTPVLAVAIVRLGAFSTGIVARAVAPDSEFTVAVIWLIALGLPALACAFLVGLVRWRLFIARAMQRLATRGRPGPEGLRNALADAFDDPTLDVVYRLEEPEPHWADVHGHKIELAALASGRAVTEARDGDRLVAAIVHDPALAVDRAFVDSATSYAAITLDNHRLAVQTSALLREVRDSRARIQAAADHERRRIEHDLHDGAQQRLVALRIKLELAAEQAGDGNGNGHGAATLRALGREIDEAVDEVRALARGIYPGPLAARGVVEALRAAALRTALPTSVLAAGVGRYSREIETAAYFCCLEAMQNADKHAAGATAAVIEITDNGALTLEVCDDGAGFDVAATGGGVGLVGMRDRLAAVGGRLEIDSRPAQGTRVRAVIPLAVDGFGAAETAGHAPP